MSSELYAGERTAQRHAERFYTARGFRLLTREGSARDCVLEIGGKPTLIAEQFRPIALPFIRIEILERIDTLAPGWLFQTRCELFHFFTCGPKWRPARLYAIDWPAFRQWFAMYVREHGRIQPSDRSRRASLNVDVPLAAIPLELSRTYDVAGNRAA